MADASSMALTPANAGPTVSAKNFLTNAERQFGTAFYAGVGVIGLVVAYALRGPILGLLDFATTALQDTITLAITGVVAFMLWGILTSKQTWAELRMLNYRIVRGLSDAAMKSDPFGRMRAFADEWLGEQYQKFNDACEQLQAVINSMQSKLQAAQDRITVLQGRVRTCEARYHVNGQWTDDNMHDQFREDSNELQLLTSRVTKLTSQLNRGTLLVKVLDKWRQSLRLEIKLTKMTADMLEDDYKTANSFANATDTAANIMGGNSEMKAADDRARAYVEQLTSARLARSETVLKQLPELTRIADLDGDAAEQAMLQKLHALDADATQSLTEVQRQIDAGPATIEGTVVKSEPATVATGHKYL